MIIIALVMSLTIPNATAISQISNIGQGKVHHQHIIWDRSNIKPLLGTKKATRR